MDQHNHRRALHKRKWGQRKAGTANMSQIREQPFRDCRSKQRSRPLWRKIWSTPGKTGGTPPEARRGSPASTVGVWKKANWRSRHELQSGKRTQSMLMYKGVLWSRTQSPGRAYFCILFSYDLRPGRSFRHVLQPCMDQVWESERFGFLLSSPLNLFESEKYIKILWTNPPQPTKQEYREALKRKPKNNRGKLIVKHHITS